MRCNVFVNKLFFLILILGTFFLSVVPRVKAATPSIVTLPNLLPLQMLQIDPIISEYQLIPGQDTIVLVNINNLSDQPVGIHAMSSTLADPQTGESMPTNMQASALVSWITIENPDIILGAKEKKQIGVTVHTPANAEDGGYAATIYITPFVHADSKNATPIVLSRIGAVILGTVGTLNYDNLVKKVIISKFATNARIIDTSPVSFTFDVENSYFTYFTAKPFLTLKPLFGKPQIITLAEKHIFPGTVRSWQILQDIPNRSFFYTADLAVSVGNGDQILASTWFLVMPYWFVVAMAFVFLLVLLMKLKKRLLLVWKVLIRG